MSSRKSRAERMTDLFAVEDDENHRQYLLKKNEKAVERENQKFWALYRSLDVSQREVKDLVSPMVETSQSSVSRIIREKEDTVLTDEEALRIGGSIHEEDLQLHPDEWLEAYRQVLADAKANIIALRAIESEKPTPEWAAKRYPRLVGCNRHFHSNLPGDGEIADDSGLNRLKNVNTDRWK